LQLSVFIAVPFFGFGFADNFIMIVCGDAIDSHFGATLGLTTMAAAGLGNWVSDVVGLGLGDAIERHCERLGLSNGRLTPAQEKLNIAKWTRLAARVFGISLGCVAGMCPLMFLTPSKKEFTEKDFEVYDKIFRNHGVTAAQFSDLLDMSTSRVVSEGNHLGLGARGHFQSEEAMVQSGAWKIILILHGEAVASQKSDGKKMYKFIGRLDEDPTTIDRKVPIRGSMVGGKIFADPTLLNKGSVHDLICTSAVECLEWDYKELREFMDKEASVEAAFIGLLANELLTSMKKEADTKSLFHYRQLLLAVISDGIVSDKERIFMADMRQSLSISESEHFEILVDLGWDREGWEKGTMSHTRGFEIAPSTSRKVSSRPLQESVRQLQQASTLIEDAMANVSDAMRCDKKA
jgi:hypothetical protein